MNNNSNLSDRLKKAHSPEPRRDGSYVLPFGQYKGLKLEQIIEIDPNYADWLRAEGIVKYSPDAEEFLNASLMEWGSTKMIRDTEGPSVFGGGY